MTCSLFLPGDGALSGCRARTTLGDDHDACSVCGGGGADGGRLLMSPAGGNLLPNCGSHGQRPPLHMEVAIRCTAPNCSCDCFSPCKAQIRMCDGCGHGWVSHALDKLGFRHLFNCHQVELVQPSIAFDIASLMLYGTQAIPIRLKILLDRLFSVLQHEEVLQVLHGFSWTYEDYARGYILQDAAGHVLDRWLLATREEEPLILQQFLRFGETKAIAQQLLLQESSERPEFIIQSPRTDSDIKKFIERTNRAVSTALIKHCPMYGTTSSLPFVNRPLFRQPSSVSSTHSLSPPAVSPVNSSSPMALSPLNKLQNMQPYDYRRDKMSPDIRTSVEVTVSSASQSTPLSSPTTATTVVASAPLPVSTINSSTNHTSTYPVSSDMSATDGGSDEDTSSAINLTRPTTGYMDSIFAAKKVRHLRKSANPMKRRWNPMVLSTLSTNPATGKKRVQCHVCLKTFCDKGALKIHFSAVHLREMHKCTVEGCNMMFSSRRSRNRHSANPNPKLHTPNFRRKINPHDGRTANPYPLMPPTGLIGFSNSAHPSSSTSILDGDSSSASEADKKPSVNTSVCIPPPEMNVIENIAPSTAVEEETALPLTKKCRIENTGNDDDLSNCGDEGIDLSIKDDPLLSNKGVRKRKSLNPTKCAVASDDDIQYVSTDDSSSDTYIDQDNDENGMLDSKSDYLSSDGMDSKDEEDTVKDDINEKKEKNMILKISSNISASPVEHEPHQQLPPKTPSSVINHYSNYISTLHQSKFMGEKPSCPEANDISSLQRESVKDRPHETEDICENPLRHLESLSLGAFNNMVNTTRSHMNHITTNSSGVSYHAPGLGLATATVGNRCDSPSDKNIPVISHTPSLVPPPLSSGILSSDQENSLSDQQMPLLPVFRDASLVGSVEIPVDKENPRRCTACGKIFQNHFGVKTHYQNVHLKLMHKCTVEGCNAAFPSKRSRDRHSANLNLHRKLLSTSSEKSHSFFDKSALYPFHTDAAIRGEFFTRLYDPQSLPLSFADLYHSRISGEGFVGGPPYATHLAALTPGFHPAFLAPPATTSGPLQDGASGRDSPTSSFSSPPSLQGGSESPQQLPRNLKISVKLEEELQPDDEGKYSCDLCEKKFHESVVLREHYEQCHTQALLQCTTDGCNKVFLSRRTRNLHSDDLHKEKASAVS